MAERFIVATIKSWNINNYEKLILRFPDNDFQLITEKEELNIEKLKKYAPKYIFFPHWSWMIPSTIYKNFDCIVFHMTDLPFGRGGSPLQNLLIRGIYNTKISAIKACAGIDAGPIYLKKDLNIGEGNANDILIQISNIVFNEMIPEIIRGNLSPIEQRGDVVEFKRRKAFQSEIPVGLSKRQLYDFIRMLDGEGYPPAFQMIGKQKVIYRKAEFADGKLTAEVEFVDGDLE